MSTGVSENPPGLLLLKASYGHEVIGRFVVGFKDEQERPGGPRLILNRDGLGWKLTRVELGNL